MLDQNTEIAPVEVEDKPQVAQEIQGIDEAKKFCEEKKLVRRENAKAFLQNFN